jgi:uncharacterized membrane protein YccC
VNDIRASTGSGGTAGFGQELAIRLRRGWPDALRMVLAAVGSFALSQALHLPEAFWAVLTALVAARPHAAGTARAGLDRLVGTIAGAAVATAFALTHLHLSQLELLLAVLVPLCLLVALHDNYRAAPIAALIVLSGGMIGESPVNTALYRTSEIAVGALVAFIVSALIVPKRADNRSFDHAAMVAKLLSRFVGLVLVPQDAAEAATDSVKEQLRGELRELAVLTHTSRWRRTADTAVGRLARLMTALNADVGFIERTVARSPVKEEASAFEVPLREISGAFESLLNQAADAFAGIAQAPRTDAIDRSIASLEGASPSNSALAPGPSPQRLLFLLRTLREDCRKLCSLLGALSLAR